MACWPGGMVKASELICVRLLPTGSGGGGGGGGGGGWMVREEVEAEPQPLVMIVHKATMPKHKTHPEIANALRIAQ